MFPAYGSKYPSISFLLFSFHAPFTSFHLPFISSHFHVIWTSATFISFSCVISTFILFPFHVPFVSYHFTDMFCSFSLQVPLLFWFSVIFRSFILSSFYFLSLLFAVPVILFTSMSFHFSLLPLAFLSFCFHFRFIFLTLFFQVHVLFLSLPLTVRSSITSFG
jgi:hypothetical protein